MAPIPLTIIHHDPLVRACMATALGDRPAFDLRATLQDADDFDPGRRDMDGGVVVADPSAASSLSTRGMQRHLILPMRPPIAVVASSDREWELRAALERRVRGYLSPGFDAQQLVDCVTAVHGGRRYLCPRTAARLAESLSYEALTERETAVLGLVVRGLPNKTIGRDLGISVGTVKSHLKAAYAKLEVTSRTQAIAEAQRRGLLAHTAEPTSHRIVTGSVTLPPPASAARFTRPAAPLASELWAA